MTLLTARMCLLFCLAVATGAVIHAAERTVATVADLNMALANARPGDRVVVAGGTYATTEPLLIGIAWREDAPIVITAERIGAVEISGTHGFSVASPGAF